MSTRFRGRACRLSPWLGVGLLAGCVWVWAPGAGGAPIPAEGPAPAVAKASDRGLGWLARQQNPDGSWSTGGAGKTRFKPGCTGLVVLAYASRGHTPGHGRFAKPLARAVDYLLASAERGLGIFVEEAGPGNRTFANMYNHGFATLALARVADAGYKRDRIRRALAKAVRTTIHAQHPDGGWRYTPLPEGASDVTNTATQVAALLAAAKAGAMVPKAPLARALAYIRSLQALDGGFAYMARTRTSAFPRSAAALFALLRAADDDRMAIKRAIRYLNALPDEKRGSFYFYGQYYATRAMSLVGSKSFKAWYPAVRDAVLQRQQADGSWKQPTGSAYATAMAVLVLNASAPK